MITLLPLLLVYLSLPGFQDGAAAEKMMFDGVPVVNWEDAANYYDREAIVHGSIVLTRNIGDYVFLNFHPNFRTNFTTLIRSKNFDAFPTPPERMYRGKYVAVRGRVIKYRGKPEIVIESPAEIVVWPETPRDILAALKDSAPKARAGGGIAPAAAGAPSGIIPAVSMPGRLTVAEVNLASVVRDEAEFCKADRPADAPVPAGFRRAADTLKMLNADLVAVQWGGSADCLNRFNRQLLKELNYPYVVAHPDAKGRVEGALLSRVPLLQSKNITQFKNRKGDSTAFRHAPLQVELQMASGELLVLVVVYMPAKADKMKVSQVKAEAKGLRTIIEEAAGLRKDANVLVLGGFGDSVDGKVVRLLAGDGETAVTIPGYTPPPNKKDPKPTIAQVENFILTNAAAKTRYVAGSTKVEKVEGLGAVVAFALRIGPAKSTPPQSRQSKPGGNDDF